MSFDDDVDDVMNELNELAGSVEDAAADGEVGLAELLSDSFIRDHTEFETLEEMLQAAAQNHVVKNIEEQR